jgi:hypothetical protein
MTPSFFPLPDVFHAFALATAFSEPGR